MEQLSEITDALQNISCGAPFIPQDRELRGVFVVRQNVSWAVQVINLYYSCGKFEEICCWCGASEPEARTSDATRVIYKVGNPVCQECTAAGKRPVAICKKSRMPGGKNE